MAANKDELVSMKRPKASLTMAMSRDPDDGNYGYGLCLRLENFELDALKLATPQAGREFKITAVGKVVSVNTEDEGEGDVDRAVTIQITELQLR